LDFESIRDLPESHAWTDETCTHDLSSESKIVHQINLTAPNVVELVGNACHKWGTFQVTNHQVPSDLVDDVEAHVRRLFGLPTEQKLKALRAPDGATGYGVARISPFFSKLMWHEGFTIMGSAVEHAKQLWPNQYEEFCDAMENYQKQIHSLAYKIMIIILKALGLEEKDQETIVLSSLSQYTGALQLNSYPSCPNPNRAIGLAPHTDTLLLTILHQNDTNGLQILQEGIGWITVPPVAGALVVNIGDLMHILSNTRFPTVYHRVVPSETSHRFTIGYFYGPSTDSTITPLAKTSYVPLFRPVMVKEYIGLKNEHLEKALDLIRV
ncbi:gibberellin 3-beta-dioxygenase 1, partial [Phtheirospermum japonicum]